MLPPDNEKRWRRLVVLVSPSEMARIDEAAQRAGLSRGAFVRTIALQVVLGFNNPLSHPTTSAAASADVDDERAA